ncbi:MAG: response regulator [Myxococcaceae bacterium]
MQQQAEISGVEAQLSPVVPSQRVLLVESDESARSVLSVTLKASGLSVIEADTGAMALKLLRDEAPELAIVSTDLNGEDGLSVVAQMRGENPERILPVVLLAKDGESGLEQLSKVVDADEVLLKPAFAKEVAAVAVMQLSERTLDGTVKLDATQAPPNQLLRALLNGDRSGVFELCGGRAHIAFRKGTVIDAQVDRHHGPDALVKALAIHAGPYRVAFRPVQFQPAFELGVKDVLQKIEPRLRAFTELAEQSVDLESRLEIEFQSLAKALPSLPDAANAVVRLFDGLRSVRQVVLDSPQDELLTLQVTQRLLALGIIKVAEEHVRPSGGVVLFGNRKDDADQQMSELFSAPIQLAVASPEQAETAGGSTDWADVLIKGEPEGDPSAGWVAGKLEPELAKQLEAFDIKAIDEAPRPKEEQLSPAVQELKDFAAPIPLTEAVKPVAPAPEVTPIEAASIDALEDGFFDHPSRSNPIPEPSKTPPRPKAGSTGISAAALKAVATTTTSQTLNAVTPEAKRPGTMTIAALLLVVAVAVVAAMFAQRDSGETKPVAPVEVAPAPAPAPEPAPAEVVKVEKPATQEMIDAAAKLYEDGKLEEALKALEQIVDDDPSSVPALLLMSEVKLDWGDLSGAGEAANNVLALDAKNARAHLLLATIHITQWRKETDPESKAKFRKAADAEIQQALDADPNGKFADEARALLKR